MSLNNSLYTAVSALNAQSTALSIVSDNLANSETTGYKASSATFQELVTPERIADRHIRLAVSLHPTRNMCRNKV